MNYLLEALKTNPLLALLDLSGNYIQLGKETLKQTVDDYKKEHKQVTPACRIDISQNFLNEDCEEEFKEKIAVQCIWGKSFYKQYAFFVTKPTDIESVIDTHYKISDTSWLVCFTCKKGTEHAMIYLEGMKSSGQRFLERFHITAEGGVGIAHVLDETIPILHFKREQYYFKEFQIDNIQGVTLQRLVQAQKGKEIPFSKYYNSSSRGTVNCVKWAIDRLKEINIKVDETILGLPSSVAGGSSCVIM